MYIIWFYFILFYFFWKAYKRAHSNHNSQKKTKKNKTDKNYQISEDLKYQGIFWKNAFLEAYIYNFILFFWKICKVTYFNHNRQKKNPKVTRITKFLNTWNIKVCFGKKFPLKYLKVYWYISSEKQFCQQFHCFLFHGNILFTSKLLLSY